MTAPDAVPRLLLITPVRDEAEHIEAVVEAVEHQTRPPDRWVVVDDGSSDATPEILRRLERRVPFMEVIEAAPLPVVGASDRLAAAAEVRAFNLALEHASWTAYDYVGKLDGDVVLPDGWFEALLERFSKDPALGVAGGDLVEPGRRGWRLLRIPRYHVHGAVKLYSRDCLLALGGVEERLGWDTIDETRARMLGYHTRSFEELVGRHLRPWGTAGSRLRGRARYGECAYVARYGFVWVALRSLKVAVQRPLGVSGAAFLLGYLNAAATRAPRVEDREFRRFVRRELRARWSLKVRSRQARYSGEHRPRTSGST